ncbi:hypothetical protein HN51_047511 [Arachis hypogaea]|uniref:DUF7036 domain-containing protein n=1 Tax=Arachis hypogaea TaxID=3818 RepID=A0A445AGZ9_ARAHY|nr:nischarin [Arachis ipaensis]XP_025632921.1 nischarin isoform X1 [Arachis hypogaea]QHO23877.1 uncharacterized protein DS421_12g367350 [Arachis hypogaea]RYR25713.1 hypothetical protein Ahy_B02g059677 [Arachis hypogaea]
MGKSDEEHHQPLPPGAAAAEDPRPNVAVGGSFSFSLRCLLVLLFSAAVFLSALFFLPPFANFSDQKDPLSHSQYKGHDIVARFFLEKPASLLEENTVQLANDIFEEIGVPSTKVVILSLDSFPGSNTTKVVFAVDPDRKYSEMSSATLSLIRALFKSLVIRQSFLQLTPSLFGKPSFFEVLKFKGGITIIPEQKVFPLQHVQPLFNFTLYFSIYQIQSSFDRLTSQLKSGLHLASDENVYVVLSNSEGSTIAAPTIVQASVLLEYGITPSKERLKQLAQTITGPRSDNLGLNNTQFGRVKQVQLSSILQHSLNGSRGSGSIQSPSSAPGPMPHTHHHHHRHHHHHQLHNDHLSAHLSPASSPTPAPAPAPASASTEGATPPEVGSPAASVPAIGRSYHAQPPSCQPVYKKRSTRKALKHSHVTPAVAHTASLHYPVESPKQRVESPAYISHSIPAESPLPNVAFAHAESPAPKNEPAAAHSDTYSTGPSPSSSSAGYLGTVNWASVMFVLLVLHV